MTRLGVQQARALLAPEHLSTSWLNTDVLTTSSVKLYPCFRTDKTYVAELQYMCPLVN